MLSNPPSPPSSTTHQQHTHLTTTTTTTMDDPELLEAANALLPYVPAFAAALPIAEEMKPQWFAPASKLAVHFQRYLGQVIGRVPPKKVCNLALQNGLARRDGVALFRPSFTHRSHGHHYNVFLHVRLPSTPPDYFLRKETKVRWLGWLGGRAEGRLGERGSDWSRRG